MRDPNKITITDKILAATFLKKKTKRVTPNQITIFRFFTVPFVALLLWIGEYQIGTALFIVSAFTDALDGALARTTKRVTKWGSTFDPLADKLLIGLTAFLILPRYMGPWIVFLMIFLEMTLIGMGYYNRARKKDYLISANWWGKSKMILQTIGVSLVLIYVLWPLTLFLMIAQFVLYIAIALAIISLVTYSL